MIIKNNITKIHRSIAYLLLLSELLTSCGFKETIVPLALRPSTCAVPIEEDHSSLPASDSTFQLSTTTIAGTKLTFDYTPEAGLQANYQAPKMAEAVPVQQYPIIQDVTGVKQPFSQLTKAEVALLATAGKWEVNTQGALHFLGIRGRGGMHKVTPSDHAANTSRVEFSRMSVVSSLEKSDETLSRDCNQNAFCYTSLPACSDEDASSDNEDISEEEDLPISPTTSHHTIITPATLNLERAIPLWVLCLDTLFDIAQLVTTQLTDGIWPTLLFKYGILRCLNVIAALTDFVEDLYAEWDYQYRKYQQQTSKEVTSSLYTLYRNCCPTYAYGYSSGKKADESALKELYASLSQLEHQTSEAEALITDSSSDAPSVPAQGYEALKQHLKELGVYYDMMNDLHKQREMHAFVNLEYRLKMLFTFIGVFSCVYTLWLSKNAVGNISDYIHAVYRECISLQDDVATTDTIVWNNNTTQAFERRKQLLEPFIIGLNGVQTFIMSLYKIYYHRKKMDQLFTTLNLNIYQEAKRSNYHTLYHKIERINIAREPAADDTAANLKKLHRMMGNDIVSSKDWRALGIEIQETAVSVDQKFLDEIANLLQKGEVPFVVLDPGISIWQLREKLFAKSITKDLEDKPHILTFYNDDKKEGYCKHFFTEPCVEKSSNPKWLLLTISDAGILPGTRVTKYAKQEEYMHEKYPGYRIGDARELCIVAFGGALIGKKLFPKCLEGSGQAAGRTSVLARVQDSWKKEKVIISKNGDQIKIISNQICLGNLSEQGLGVTFYGDSKYFDYLGLFSVFST